MTHHVPPITDPMGYYWNQPPREDVLIDDFVAMMTRETFDKLLNYERSCPSGTYEGKMWRRGDLLYWYEESRKPGMIQIEHRTIFFV